MGSIEASTAWPVPAGIEVRVHDSAEAREIFVSGELDMATRDILDAAVLQTPPHLRLILDLGGLTFADSAGVHLLIKARARFGDRLEVTAVPPRMARLLSLCDRSDLALAA